MRFSLFIVALGLCAPLFGQTGNTLIQPDCLIPFTFTAAGSFPALPTTNGAGDNRTKGCAAWTLMYQNTGMTAVTVTLQSGSTPTTTVSWGTFAGTISTGYVNPIVSDTGGSLQATNGTADISWVRVNVAATGTGTLTGVLYGFRNSSAAIVNKGGSVTSIATGCFLTGGPITTTGTISAQELVNKQTGASYAILNSDCGKLVTGTNAGAEAYTIAQAGSGGNFASGWFIDLQNRGAGTLTLTPTTSTIDGAATLVLTSGQGARLVSDGSNYFTQRGMANTGGVCPSGSAGVVQKTDGTNCAASSIVDNGSTVVTTEPISAPSFTGTGSNPFINFPSNVTHMGASGDLWNNAGILNFGATPLQIVTGPASATSGHLATFNGISGAVLQDGGTVPTGTVTSISTTSPIAGGTITASGTISCPTCGVTGTGLGQFASTTSAQLATVISDETGTGLLVFGSSPALTTPTFPSGSLAGPPVASYNAGIQGEFSFAPTGMGVIDQESTFPNVLKVIKQSSTASSASAAISGRGYGVGATNLAYLGGVEGETTYHGTGNPVLLFGSAGHVIVDAASTPGLATAFYADSPSISNTTVPFATSFYAKPPALSSGGAVTTFAPLYLFGRPLGADVNILTDLGTLQTLTARTTAGTTDSPVYSLRASSFDTVAHTVDWQTIDHPTSNAGASAFRIQNRVDGAGFADKFAVDSTGVASVVGVKQVGTTFTGSGCGINTLVGGALSGSFKVTAGGCAVTITFGAYNAGNGVHCTATDSSTATFVAVQAETTTSVTLVGTYVNNDIITFGCTVY